MKRVGILYLCTGPYVAFWEQFYQSFEKYFLPNTKKHYYVFTDANEIYEECNQEVTKIYLEHKVWPLITLLRFSTFLTIESQLYENDYLVFSNANLMCAETIYENEILPSANEKLFFVEHPGYFDKKPLYFVYERRKISNAYIPYNCGEKYVIGAFFGGETKSFIEMSKKLKENIEKDLRNNIIARWHDESHINRYIADRCDVKILPPSYCYPYGFDIACSKKICTRGKQEVFDISAFKGWNNNAATMNKKTIKYQMLRIQVKSKPIMRKIWLNVLLVRDKLFRRKL